MTKVTLKASVRNELGRKVKALRRKGLVPANVFGKDIKSQAICVVHKDFLKTYREVGNTGLVYLQVEGEDKDRPTLITGTAEDPSKGLVLHADFHQVNLKEKVTAHVPVEIEGESESIKSGIAILNQSLHEIEVEALPTEIPESFMVNIESLKEIGDSISVANLKAPEGVEIKTDPEIVIVSLSEPQKEEEVAPAEESAEISSEESKEGQSSSEEAKEESQEEAKAE